MARIIITLCCVLAWSIPAVAENFNELRNVSQRKKAPTVSWGEIIHTESRFGLPTFVRVVDSKPSPRFAHLERSAEVEATAMGYLVNIARDYGLEQSLSSIEIDHVHDLGEGTIVVTLKQTFNDIEVWGHRLKLVLDQDLNLTAVTGFLSPYLPESNFSVHQDQAFAIAHNRTVGVQAKSFSKKTANGGFTEYASGSNGRHRVKPAYLMRPDSLEPAFYSEIEGPNGFHSVVVSAVDGRVAMVKELVLDHSYRVYADAAGLNIPFDGPQGTNITPHPTGFPDGIEPTIQSQNLVNILNGPISTGDPWLAPGATTTNGNNAQAYADLVAPDGFTTGDVFGGISSANSFDYVFNSQLLPGANNTQIQATIVQAFYTINYMHDLFYDSGFNEAAGNPQSNNFGRGGVAGDPILIEVQDFNVTNNANAFSPTDGGSPRIQMGLFSNDSKITVNSPASVAGDYITGSADFGPQAFDVTGNLVLVDDGQVVGDDGATSDACETPFLNAAQIAGNIAFIDRGECFFADKTANAQAAGATAVLIANHNPGEGVLNMGAPDNPPVVNIPVLLVSFEDGQTFKNAAGLVNVRLLRGQIQNATSSALDTTILVHEWGHVMNNRLMLNGTSQSNGMDEGWADFIAMLVVTRPEDVVTQFGGTYGVGSYAQSIRKEGNPTFPSYYYGIRRVPYSTDFSKNAFSFRHIEKGIGLPGGVNTRFGVDGENNEEVHATGEVWATSMWECYAGLLNERTSLSFPTIQRRMRNYVVAAQKAMPSNPTFTEARDSVLAVMLANDPGDHDICVRAFARRGMGSGAVSPGRFSDDHVGVVESFTTNLPNRDAKVINNIGNIADTSAPEIVALQVSDSLVNQVRVSDASSGVAQGTYGFLGSDWSPSGLVSVSGIGTSGQGIGVFATRVSDNLMGVQLRNGSDGALIRNVYPWSAAWRGLDIKLVPGQAAAGLDAIAVLAERRSDNLMGVELKDPTSGNRIRIIYPLGFGWRAEQLEVLDVNGVPGIAVLATRESDGLAIVQVRNAVSGALIRNVFPLGLGWSPVELKVIPDVNNNSVDEVAVRMTRDSDGLEIIQVRDAQTNNLVGNVYPIGAGSGGWQTQKFEALDMGSTVVLGVLSVRDSDNQVLVQLRNILTGGVIKNNFFIGPPWVLQQDYRVISDFTGNGMDELAVLMRNPQTKDRLVQIRDASTGAVIRNVFQPR